MYALFYHGPSHYYRAIAAQNRDERGEPRCNVPVYVGSTNPGGRKGAAEVKVKSALYDRLSQHKESIWEVQNCLAPDAPGHLRIEDFRCQFLVVERGWVPLLENLTLGSHQPVWNAHLDGFGNKDQSTRGGKRSLWDTLHRGRTLFKLKHDNPLTPEQVAANLEQYLKGPPYKPVYRVKSTKKPKRVYVIEVATGAFVTVLAGGESSTSVDALLGPSTGEAIDVPGNRRKVAK